MLRTIGWYTYFGISLLFETPNLFKIHSLHRKGQHQEADRYAHQTTSKWAMKQIKTSGAKIEVFGLEHLPKDQNVVFISNHQGNFDIAILMSYIDKPKGYVAKVEMAKAPLLSSWMKSIYCIFMDRDSLRGAATAISQGIKLVQEGRSLVIFPEGTRSKGGPLGDFKAGSFKLATKPKVPIVPITIDGSYKLMERQNGRIKPDTVKVYIHPAIPTTDLSKEALALLPEKVKAVIASKL